MTHSNSVFSMYVFCIIVSLNKYNVRLFHGFYMTYYNKTTLSQSIFNIDITSPDLIIINEMTLMDH